ncbi:MAG: hypothetical protein IJV77_06730 [Clostridia bacterium]|nr:hypothetical protein [Clostridia bacterium]
MYIANRYFKNTHDCAFDKCNKPKDKQPPCKPQFEPKRPFCLFEIRCTPFDDCPPEIKFELKI